MYSRQGNKRPVETFLVAAASSDLYNDAGGGAGDNITDPITGAVVLADGQLGVFSGSDFGSVANNVAIDTSPTYAEAPVIYIAQGTEWSANPGQRPGNRYPLWNVPYWRSADINGNNWILATYKQYQAPAPSVWVIGLEDGNAQEIVAYDNTEYQMRIAYRGRRVDEMYNPQGTISFNPHFVTPNYTALGTAEPRDHLIQNLTWNVNRNSKTLNINRTRFRGNEPVVALAIDSTGAAGTAIGGLTPLAAGDFLPVVNTNLGVRGITVTQEQVSALQNAAIAAGSFLNVAAITWSVLTVDLSTAGTVTGGVADLMMLMSLEADLAYEDRIAPVQTRLQVGLTTGFDFNTVYHNEEVRASEGSGEGRVWDLLYKATHGQRKYNLDHTLDPVVEFASPIDVDANYDSFIFEHVDINQIDTSNLSESPHKTIVLIPTGETTLITEFTDIMNAWLTSARGSVIVDL